MLMNRGNSDNNGNNVNKGGAKKAYTDSDDSSGDEGSFIEKKSGFKNPWDIFRKPSNPIGLKNIKGSLWKDSGDDSFTEGPPGYYSKIGSLEYNSDGDL